MSAFICKQPNGLYCRFSTVVDCPTDWNLTAEDYIELCAEQAREEAKRVLENHVYPFGCVVGNFYPHNMTLDEYEKFLKEVGYENTEIVIKNGKRMWRSRLCGYTESVKVRCHL